MSQKTIHQLIDDLIAREGGFVNHPADRGGPTNLGITQKTLSMYLARQATVADVENLSKQTASDIYYSYYYIKPGINLLPELIRPIMLDMTANMGKRSIKILQDTLTNHGYNAGKIDGKIGPRTVSASEKALEHMGNNLIKALVRRRVIFYEGLVKADETQRVFLAGWIARAESFLPRTA
jgi:lysozyme family protein